jgi:hypothetical protein
MSPAPARDSRASEKVQHLNVVRLCNKAALRTAVFGRVWPEEMRRALSGISHLYGLHALDIHVDRYDIELNGFASERFSREAILHQIGLCLGTDSQLRQERVRKALLSALRSEILRAGGREGYLHGFGIFRVRELATDSYLLQFEEPLAKYFPAEGYLTASLA